MTPDEVAGFFARGSDYLFARWGRPIAPVVFGVEDATLDVVKGALTAVTELARHPMVETDPELQRPPTEDEIVPATFCGT